MSKAKRSANTSSRVLRVLVSILLVLLLIAGGLFLFLQVKLGQIDRVDVGSSGEQDWNSAGVSTSVEGTVNVLLVGQDTRDDQRQRSDTMIVLNINKNTQQLTMVSLMRDLYVTIPGYGEKKLNAAFQYGGFELLDETISENFGITIDYNVGVDFSGFKDIIDTLGGIDINLNADEAAYLRGEGGNYENGVVGRYTNGRTYDVQEGVNHLDGSAALDYARARHVGNSDFDRTQRQRTVISTIYQDLRDSSWKKLLKVYDSISANVVTDMNNNQILSIAFSAYSMGKSDLNSYRIPEDGMYTNMTLSNGDQVLQVDDWDATRALLWDELYSVPETEDNAEEPQE